MHVEQSIVAVSRWGNSLAVRLPAALAATLKACEGESLRLTLRRSTLRHAASARMTGSTVATGSGGTDGGQSPRDGFAEEGQTPFDLGPTPAAVAGTPAAFGSHAVTVGRWGNSLALRLPRALVAELGITEGDRLRLEQRDLCDGQVVVIEVTREATSAELFAAVRALRRAFPKDYRFDRDEANARITDAGTDDE